MVHCVCDDVEKIHALTFQTDFIRSYVSVSNLHS